MKKVLLLLGFLASTMIINVVKADVRLPRLISDGMVLQRNKPLNFWGWAAPKEKVIINILNRRYQAVTGADGKWMVKVKPLPAGGPYNITVDGVNHIELHDVYVGEVWFCSGQSNMQLNMGDIHERYEDDIANYQNNKIRQFLVPNSLVNATVEHDDYSAGSWKSLNSQNALKFSAAAYFFARSLFNRQHVAVGIINASWGGTPIESWISADSLKSFPSIYEQVQRLRDTAYVNSVLAGNAAAAKAEAIRTDKRADEGLIGKTRWFDKDYAPIGWKEMMLPGYWMGQGMSGFNGVVWFRKELTLTAQQAAAQAPKLFLGRIVDADEVYVNGTLVGGTTFQYPMRRYYLKQSALHAGKNVVVVRVSNYNGNGGFVPGRPLYLAVGTDTLDLSGKWLYKVGQAFSPVKPGDNYNPAYQPMVMYNAMAAPAINYQIKGALWYQGESNTGRAKAYEQLLPALIANWRAAWGDKQLPFVYAQLPGYMEVKYFPMESNWAALRAAQRKTLAIPGTAMAVTIDLGEWSDVHPHNKKDVGERLELAAEQVAYGNKKLVSSGPVLQSARVNGGKVALSFTETGSGLVAKGDTLLRYFEVAGIDKHFVKAAATIVGNQVIVYSAEITSPAFVRYAWADNPEGANLFNKEGLPASPFEIEVK